MSILIGGSGPTPLVLERRHHDGADVLREEIIDRGEWFHVQANLTALPLHRLWRRRQLVHDGACAERALTITDATDDWKEAFTLPLNRVSLRVPFTSLRAFASEVGRPELIDIRAPIHVHDDVFHGLAQALIPALDLPQKASPLFTEQIGLAMLVHLTQTYGGIRAPERRSGGLTAQQEARAVEMLSARLTQNVSLTALAQDCGLSRSYFCKAFGITFGKPPHRWLQEYRVARASDLLRSDLPISEIAYLCGFSDQSHLTRLFKDQHGETPADWRRHRRLP